MCPEAVVARVNAERKEVTVESREEDRLPLQGDDHPAADGN
jgi:hypothetical protein